MDKDIIEDLGSLSNLELFKLFYDTKHVMEDKEISEEVAMCYYRSNQTISYR